MADIVLVAAVALNGVIGRDGAMPWKLSSDLKRFKADTIGRPIVMGRKTWEAIGKALPGRRNIVITRDRDYRADGADVVATLDEALTLAQADAVTSGQSEICIIGGGEIYRQSMEAADRLKITRVLAEIDGDTMFPVIDEAVWVRDSAEDIPAGEKDSHPTRYEVYSRRST